MYRPIPKKRHFLDSKTLLQTVIGNKGKNFVPHKLQDHSGRVLFRRNSQQLAIKARVPSVSYAAVRLINKAPVFLLLKKSLNKQNSLWTAA